MIEITGVSKSYGDTTVLHDVSTTIPARTLTGLVGRNGAGKSTLLGIMSRLDAADSGSINIDGLDIASAPTSLVATKVSVLRQRYELTARVSVRDLVSFGRYPYSKGRLRVDDRQHIDSAMEFFDLHGLANRFIDELSGGQRQRAFVAMVLAQDTDVLLLDEPLNNLDMHHSVRMMQRLRTLVTDHGKTVVIVLHDLNFASAYADSIVVMSDGRIDYTGTPSQVMQPDRLAASFGVNAHIVDHEDRPYALYFRPPGE